MNSPCTRAPDLCYYAPVKRIVPILAFLLISCNAHEGMQKITLQSGDNSLTMWVEVADDPAEQAAGLMNREELPDREGMLFVFSEPRDLAFWMKNTLIPLDILFFDEDGTFINGHTMPPCTEDPCINYRSAGKAKYALEVNAGKGTENGIGSGWRLLPINLTP